MELRHKTFAARLIGRQLLVCMFHYGRLSAEENDSYPITLSVGEYGEEVAANYVTSHSRPKNPFSILRNLRIYKLPLPADKQINNWVRIHHYPPNEEPWSHSLSFVSRQAERHRKLYYVPFSGRYRDGYAEHLRRTDVSSLVFVQRRKYSQESSCRFRFRESKLVGSLLRALSKLKPAMSVTQRTIFYEKFASKAEEGTFELFETWRQRHEDSYFILDRRSSDWDRLKSSPGVVAKFSWHYYWLIYTATLFVGTEVPTHLSLLRSNNGQIRKAFYARPYVFLQHGIIFMKNLGRTSVFVKGREGEPTLMIVSSRREAEIVKRDLKLTESQLAVTGLGQLSLIEPNSVASLENDVVTVMLTWRPYDEHIEKFEDTVYAQVCVELVTSLQEILPKAELRIIPHPKVRENIGSSKYASRMWTGSISSALEDTNLLVTDYSSLGYNAFYRGAAVLFYQPDLEEYEARVGALIPEADEYIGRRAESLSELRAILQKSTRHDGRLNFDLLRTVRDEQLYKTINEFDDGRNLERIVNAIEEKFGDTCAV